jgi:hypothetical protein
MRRCEITGLQTDFGAFGLTGVRVRVENFPVCPPPIIECAKIVHKGTNRFKAGRTSVACEAVRKGESAVVQAFGGGRADGGDGGGGAGVGARVGTGGGAAGGGGICDRAGVCLLTGQVGGLAATATYTLQTPVERSEHLSGWWTVRVRANPLSLEVWHFTLRFVLLGVGWVTPVGLERRVVTCRTQSLP